MDVEEHRSWSTSTTSSSSSDWEKEESLRVRSSRKLVVADSTIEEPPNGTEKVDEILLIPATDKSVVFDKDQGGGFKHLFSDSEPNDVQDLVFEKSYGDEVFSPITKEQTSPFNEINHHQEESQKDSSTLDLLLQPAEESSNGFIVEKSSPEIIVVNEEVNLLEETDYEETEYDVETVLEKQNTHDLYCPNCRSCITRRVILCKRKRTVKTSKDAKRNKLDNTEADLDVDATGDQGGKALGNIHEGGSASADYGVDRDRETEGFTCLSCFSFFMPAGNGFKRIRVLPSGEKTETENIEKSDTISVSKKHWWQFMFFFDKEQTSDHHEEGNIFGDLPSKKKQVEGHDNGSAVEDENSLNKNDTNILPPGVERDPAIDTKVDIHIEIPLSDNAGGSDTIIHVKDRPNEQEVPQISRNVASIGSAQQIIHTRGVSGLEIVKSIVYGGLIESITSLGIVSSAAGADAATLNILALSVANLIGGIFLIYHNIWDLKAEHDTNTSTVRRDRYQEILGRRQNFWVHATFALLSFVVFGLVPPVIYGFSFRVSDDKDFKLIAVAAGSLFCIFLLAIGKSYAQKLAAKGYVKTIVYYIISGFMASGISYVAGKFIKKLLEDLGLFESTEVLNLLPSIAETIPTETLWKSFY